MLYLAVSVAVPFDGLTALVPMDRPLLLIDVDGVVSLFGFDAANPPPRRPEFVNGILDLLSATARQYVRSLAQDFELAWCTGWTEKANAYLALALGVPEPLRRGGRHAPAVFAAQRGLI